MALSFGISFAPNHPREVSEWCRASEEAGFERIGIVDSQAIYRELYISCVAGMQATESIQLGPRVTNALTRHPTVTASALLTLNEFTGASFCGAGYRRQRSFQYWSKAGEACGARRVYRLSAGAAARREHNYQGHESN